MAYYGVLRACFVCMILFLDHAHAQVSAKKEVADRMKKLIEMIESEKPMHFKYSMYVEPVQVFNVVPRLPYTQVVHYYKLGKNVRLVLPDSIEVITKGYLGLIIDHLNKEITVGRDTLKENENPLAVFPLLADSAKEVIKLGAGEYQFLFQEEMIYKRMQMGFDVKTNQLTYLEVEMDDDMNESYKKMRINYELWDFKWKPSKNFPNQEKYIAVNGTHFKTTSAYSGYKFIDTTLPQQAITY